MAPFYSYPANYQGLVSGVAGDNNVTVPSVNEKVFNIFHREK
jgi:hypothetical protein